MGQREHSGFLLALVVVGFSAGVARAADPAPSSNDEAGGVQPAGAVPEADAGYALPLVVGIGVGYGFRPHPDERSHGGTAHLYGDLPLGLGFGVRAETLGFTYGPSLVADRPYAVPMVAGSLVYAFDDTEAVAVVGVGAFVGLPLDVGLEDASLGISGGVLVSLGLRFALLEGLRAEAGIRVPFTLVQPPPPPGASPTDDLRTQIALTGGLVFVPADLWRAYVVEP